MRCVCESSPVEQGNNFHFDSSAVHCGCDENAVAIITGHCESSKLTLAIDSVKEMVKVKEKTI